MSKRSGGRAPVKVEFRSTACRITIDRPEVRNAMNEAVAEAIRAGLATAAERPGCRAIVLTGAGERAFCAGADLGRGARGSAFRVDFDHPRHYMAALLNAMHESPLPLIARVNGHALAGGLGLACACDLIVAAEEAKLGLPEVKVGVAPVVILPPLLRAVPRAVLREMILTGEPLTAREALAHGIVNHVVPAGKLDGKVDELVRRIAANSPTALRLGRQALAAMDRLNVRDSLAYAEVLLPVMASTADAQEGMRAFQEKRKPVWRKPRR